MRAHLIILLAIGCGDGSRGGSIVAPVDQPQMDGVDRGEGIDNGGGTPPSQSNASFEPCSRQDDCSRGTCIQPDSPRPGVCLTICAAPAGGELGSVRVEPCLRTEECVILENGAGLCLRACSTNAECPSNTRCNRLESSQPARFCVPFFGGSSSGGTEPVETAPAPR